MDWDGNVEEVIEFYKTNSFTITCEVFHLSYERLTKILADNNVAKHSAKENRELTSLYRFGVNNIAQLEKSHEKAKQTTKERYGVENFRNNEKSKQTRILNSGTLENSYAIGVNKAKENNVDKYGVEYFFQTDEFKDKAKQTCLERYGVENYRNADEYSEKLKNTSLEKYGVEHYMSSQQCRDKVRATCNERYGADSWFGSEQGKQAIKEYCIKKYGYEDETLAEYFSENGAYVDKVFNWCRSIEFPYPNILNYTDSYRSLCKSDVNRFSMNARYGERVIQHFHKSVWKANKKGCLSPFDAWQDDAILKKAIQNRIIYKGNSLDPSKVLYGFSAAKIAPKVSVFNPYLARYLISKYLNEFDTIFDPCSGYSGRLLGAVSLGKTYIGRDINPVTVEESNNLLHELKLPASVECSDSLLIKSKFDCLFTCPPYSDKENWNQEIENMTCDEWIEQFLKNFSCKKYLFVVDNTTKYKENIVEELKNTSHFSNSSEYVLLFS